MCAAFSLVLVPLSVSSLIPNPLVSENYRQERGFPNFPFAFESEPKNYCIWMPYTYRYTNKTFKYSNIQGARSAYFAIFQLIPFIFPFELRKEWSHRTCARIGNCKRMTLPYSSALRLSHKSATQQRNNRANKKRAKLKEMIFAWLK